MPIDPVKIPADIQVEEKIIGPISLRQIIIIVVSGGLGYALWAIVSRAFAGNVSLPLVILSWSPVAVGVAFAFVKINNVSLLKLILLWLEKQEKPTVRRFGPREGITINIRTHGSEKKKTSVKKEEKPGEGLKELGTLLDTGLTELSKEEELNESVEQIEELPTRPVDPNQISTSISEGQPSIDSVFSEDEPSHDLPQL